MGNAITVGRLGFGDARSYKTLRLLALRSHPEYFGASLEEEAALSESAFAQRLTDGTIFGVSIEGELVGCAGVASREKEKLCHKAILWGMFVKPEVRGRGIGKRLLGTILEHAQSGYEELLLTVVAENEAAYDLYKCAGFEEYGREPGAIRIGAKYYDEILMRLPFKRL